MSPLVVQMHGEPGSGKSTIARALAPRIEAIVLDKDVIKAALLRAGIAEECAAPAAYDVYFAQAEDMLRRGHNVILDNPVFWPSVEARWHALCDRNGSSRLLIECVCADQAELSRRLGTRDALESQPRAPLDLTRHPGAAATTFQPRLVLDTTRPLADLVDDALAYIDCSRRVTCSPSPLVGEGAGG